MSTHKQIQIKSAEGLYPLLPPVDPQNYPKYFLVSDLVPPTEVVVDGVVSTHTAPILFGTKCSLLTLTDNPALREFGFQDMTDNVGALSIDAVWMRVMGDYVRVPVANVDYVENPQGNYRTMGLSRSVEIELTCIAAEDMPSSLSVALSGLISAKVFCHLSGSLNMEDGEHCLTVGGATISQVKTVDGRTVLGGMNDPVLFPLNHLIERTQYAAFEPRVIRVNPNRRPRQPEQPTKIKTLQEYFDRSPKNAIDHSLRISRLKDGSYDFYIHPSHVSGETADFRAIDNMVFLVSTISRGGATCREMANLGFGYAIELAKRGYDVVRFTPAASEEGMPVVRRLAFRDGVIVTSSPTAAFPGPYVLTQEDMLANDWTAMVPISQ